MKVIDHSVSKESFELVYQSELHMYATRPQPSEKDLPEYYKSEAYISHTDSKKSGMDKIYQRVKKIALRSKRNLINRLSNPSEKTILDIGCGTGDFLQTMIQNGWNGVGVEPNEEARALAQKKNIDRLYASLDDLLNLQTQSCFDVITLWHVLEHVPDYDSYIQKIQKLLSPDGILIVAVPNFESYDAQYYQSFWAAYDVPRHLWHFSKRSIQKIFEAHVMEIVKTVPMYFDSFYVAMLSEKYKSGKTNFLRAFFIGLMSNSKAMISGNYSSLIFVLKNTKN